MQTLASGSSLTVTLERGQSLYIRGSAEVYERTGSIQIVNGDGRFGPYAVQTSITIKAVGTIEYSENYTEESFEPELIIGNDGKQVIGIKNPDGTFAYISVYGGEAKLLELAGSPVYDTRVVGRIWAMFPTVAAGFEGNWNDIIKYSDDWGDTWTTWTTFAPFPKPSNNTTMAMDSQGNIYLMRSNGVISRIDATTKAVTDVITLFPTGGVWNFYNWNFTEGRDGRIYISGYKVAVGSHYLWVSPAGGNAFVRKDFLVNKYPLDSHFHSFKMNPYTGKLWLTWGDSAIKSLVAVSTGTDATILATDNFDAEFTVVNGNAAEFGAGWPKPTDITPTSETMYMADDRPGSANWVTNVQNGEVRRVYKHEPPFDLLPGYYIKSCGDNEFWVSTYDEITSSAQTATLCKFTKDPGVDSYLRLVAKYQLDDPNTSGWQQYSIACNQYGQIPRWAKMIMLTRFNSSTGKVGIYLIPR